MQKEFTGKGEELFEATLHASKMRLRPIDYDHTLAFSFACLAIGFCKRCRAKAKPTLSRLWCIGRCVFFNTFGYFLHPCIFVWIRSILYKKLKTLNTQSIDRDATKGSISSRGMQFPAVLSLAACQSTKGPEPVGTDILKAFASAGKSSGTSP